MSKGIALIAIGRYGYLQWAANMAASLKYHSPTIPIQLITSGFLQPDAEAYKTNHNLFDIITVVSDNCFMQDGKLFPAKLKTDFYRHLVFDETVYLDVDGCTIQDIAPLFDCKADFASDVQGVHELANGETFEQMKWARPDVVWFHFGLPATAKLPALNSSFMFIRKSEFCQQIFETAHRILMDNPLPHDMHWHPWGNKRKTKNNQPDELYFNVALAELGIIPHHLPAIHFRMVNEPGDYIPLEELAKTYYGIGLFGELRTNHMSLREYYNKHMRECWRHVTGQTFHAKCEILSESKFVIQ